MKMPALIRVRPLSSPASSPPFLPVRRDRKLTTKASAVDAVTQENADLYQIDQIEETWHRAASTHNVNLMMSLWAPGAVFNIGQQTLTGKAQIRNWFATENKAFMPTATTGSPTRRRTRSGRP